MAILSLDHQAILACAIAPGQSPPEFRLGEKLNPTMLTQIFFTLILDHGFGVIANQSHAFGPNDHHSSSPSRLRRYEYVCDNYGKYPNLR